MELSLEVRRHADAVAVAVTGEIDMHTAPELGGKLRELIEGGEHRIVLDLSGVDFLDSTGLGVMVGAMKELSEHGGWMRLVCPEERVLRVFRITGLDQKVAIFGTQDAALAQGLDRHAW